MRSSTGGWVLNRPAKLTPFSGLTMNMWAIDGFTGSGRMLVAISSFSRARASESGLP